MEPASMHILGPALISAASLAAGLLFAHVAHHVAKRRYSEDVQTIAISFAVAWGGFAFIALNDGLRILLGAYAPGAFAWYTTLAVLKIFANAAIIWGLGVYVTYLWLGRTRVLAWGLAGFATAHALFFLYAYQVRNPVGITNGGWVPRLVFDGPSVLPAPLGTLALVFYFLPPIVLVLVYAAFAKHLHERTLRYRVAATALAVATFQAANLFHSNPKIPGDSTIFPVLAVVTIVAGLVAHATYYPPAWLARWARLDRQAPATVRTLTTTTVQHDDAP